MRSNALAKAHCQRNTKYHYLDPSINLFDTSGKPDPQLYVEDDLHLNEKGYKLWVEQIYPALQKLKNNSITNFSSTP